MRNMLHQLQASIVRRFCRHCGCYQFFMNHIPGFSCAFVRSIFLKCRSCTWAAAPSQSSPMSMHLAILPFSDGGGIIHNNNSSHGTRKLEASRGSICGEYCAFWTKFLKPKISQRKSLGFGGGYLGLFVSNALFGIILTQSQLLRFS